MLEKLVFENRYLEGIDYGSLTQKEKDAYFIEFVGHYLPASFGSELLGNPIHAVVFILLGFALKEAGSITAAVLSIVGTGLSVTQIVQGLMLVIDAGKIKETAASMRELKAAAKIMAQGMARIGIEAIPLLIAAIKLGKDGKPDIETTKKGEATSQTGLPPNTKYVSGEFNYIYKTDSRGRISECEAPRLYNKKHEGRLKYNPNTPDKALGDHAGHIIADVFGGSPDLDNLVSQARLVNQSEYRKIEIQWRKAIELGKDVTDIKINIIYEGTSSRPTQFIIQYKIDGDLIKHYPIIN